MIYRCCTIPILLHSESISVTGHPVSGTRKPVTSHTCGCSTRSTINSSQKIPGIQQRNCSITFILSGHCKHRMGENNTFTGELNTAARPVECVQSSATIWSTLLVSSPCVGSFLLHCVSCVPYAIQPWLEEERPLLPHQEAAILLEYARDGK